MSVAAQVEEYAVAHRSRGSRVVHAGARAFVLPFFTHFPVHESVHGVFGLVEKAARLAKHSPDVRHATVQRRTWSADRVVPLDGTRSPGAILYLHGGAFIACGPATHRAIVEHLAVTTGMLVLAVDYRQWPHGRVADAVEDCVEAFDWLREQGYDDHEVVVAGDSAGGYLSFAVTLALREQGLRPAGVVGISPWLDLDPTDKLAHANCGLDAYIPAKRFRRLARTVLGHDPEAHHSPVNADLRGFPPVLLQCGATEVLRVDAELAARRLEEADVPCTLQLWHGQVHAFPVLAGAFPEATAAAREVAAFATTCVAEAATGHGVRRPRRRLRAVPA